MAGVTTGTALAEGDVVIELPRNSLLDLELLGSLPEDGLRKRKDEGANTQTFHYFVGKGSPSTEGEGMQGPGH